MLLLLLFTFAFLQGGMQVGKVRVAGNARFPVAAIAAASGIRPGSSFTKQDLDAACQRLIRSGLFAGCNYRYTPVSATSADVDLQITEAPAEQAARLTIPGVAEAELWAWLKQNEPLIQTKMPGNDDAIEFYSAAVQRYLRDKKLDADIRPSIETNLETREIILIFRPAKLAKIDSVHFTGNAAIESTMLEKVLLPVAKGTGFTEYDFRLLLDQNIVPLYRERGFLSVAFPQIAAQGSVVTTAIAEGPVYQIGRVHVVGGTQSALRPGELANWKKIQAEAERIVAGSREEGHLQAVSKIQTKLDETSKTVDLEIQITPGERFSLGELRISGLAPELLSRVKPLWTLQPGTPVRESAIATFVRAAFEKGGLGPEYRGVAQHLNFRPGSNVVDVEITFRR